MLKATQFLKTSLDQSSAICALVDNRIYPIFPKGGVKAYPFIFFESKSIGQDDSKDGSKRVITATISCSGETAEETERLADIILEELGKVDNNAYGFDSFTFVSEDETYAESVDKYIVAQVFTFETL